MRTAPRVLVTGGEGLVGSALVANLLAAGHEVTTLTLPDVTPHPGVRVVRGDARDPAAVAAAVEGVDAVAHLAAIASPYRDPAPVLFGTNTSATFTVLWTAAERGVARLVIASSANATGLLLNPHRPLPPRYPVDESVPPRTADPYSLAKQVDELTLAAVCRRFAASGVALRLPLMIGPDNVEELRRWKAERGDEGAADGWAWLDVRDGAEAFRLALTADYDGAHVVVLAAPEVFDDRPTEELLRRFAPDVARDRSYPGHEAPIDTRCARELFGFVPRHPRPFDR